MKLIETVADLSSDPSNANAGTERGMDLLRESIEQCGVGRGILVDKHGVVIGGNKTLEVARQMGIPIKVVQTNGHDLVVVRRLDLDLVEDPKARQMSYYDNRVQELDLKWAPRQVQADILAGVDVTSSFFPEEVDRLLAEIQPEDQADFVGVEVLDVSPLPVEAVEAPGLNLDLDENPKEPAKKEPALAAEFTFENITQQIRWTAFMRALREKYPDAPTQASRLAAYLTERGFAS